MQIEISERKWNDLKRREKYENKLFSVAFYCHAENFEAVYELITFGEASIFIRRTKVENGTYFMPNGDICDYKLTIEITLHRLDKFIKRYMVTTRRIIGDEFLDLVFGKVFYQIRESRIEEL